MDATPEAGKQDATESQTRPIDGSSRTDEFMLRGVEEISEDAYRQNDVYRAWNRQKTPGFN